MLRYIAVVYEHADKEQCGTAEALADMLKAEMPTLASVFDASGLRVWSNAPTPYHEVYRLANDCGVVFGTLFRRGLQGENSSRCPRDIEEKATRAIDDSAGKALVERFWGRYVAFLSDKRTGGKSIMRDASGGIACFMTDWRGVRIFFSDVKDCLRLGVRLTIDWSYVASHITIWALEGEQTFLREVRSVQRGARTSLRKNEWTTELIWSPAQVAFGNEFEDKSEASRELWHAVWDTVISWASVFTGIVVHVSGGLDSSILYSLLSRTGKPVTGLNYYSEGNDSDEREYARCMANFLARPLIERQLPWEVDLSTMLTCGKGATLDLNPFRIATSRSEALLCRELGANGCLSGGGGDQVFGTGLSALAAADFARKHGFRPRTLPVALNGALLERRSIYSVLAAAFRLGVMRTPRDPLYPRRNYLASDYARRVAEEFVPRHHGWWSHREELPPAKLAQVVQMAGRGDLSDPFEIEGDPDAVEPYMSQRVQEACARVPVYLLAANGWDRELQRQTFAPCLPQRIARRRNKGAISENVHALFRHNVPFVRSVLCGGLLEQQGLLNREALDGFLADDPQNGTRATEAFHMLSAECRLRAWVSA